MEDAAWPFGHRTDYHAVWDAFVAAYAAADFIVVELGELACLDAYADWLGHRQMENLRADSVHRIDQFIGRLLSWPPAAGQLLLVVSPSPPAAARRHGFHLAPLAVAVLPSDRGATPSEDGGGVAVTGLITSNTTRRAGIVSNTDIAPTILAALGVPTHRFSGTPMTQRPLSAFARDAPPFAAPAPDAWSAVQRMYEWATLTNSLRAPVVRTFIGFSIAVFIGWIAWMAYTSIGGGRSSAAGRAPWAPLWRWVLLLLMSVPLAVLLLPMAEPKDSPTALVVIGLVAVALTTAAFVLCGRHGTDGFVALALATAAALVVDVAAGARLIKNSVLGYDPIVAARFLRHRQRVHGRAHRDRSYRNDRLAGRRWGGVLRRRTGAGGRRRAPSRSEPP